MAGATPGRLRGCGGRAGAGVIRGYAFTRRAPTHPSGKAAAPGPEPEPGWPGRCSPPGPAPRSFTAGLPRARRPHRLQPVFVLIFTAGHLKNSLVIPRVALSASSELFFLFVFFKEAGGQSLKIIFLVILR